MVNNYVNKSAKNALKIVDKSIISKIIFLYKKNGSALFYF